jgi:hypothetical protein
MGRYCRRFFRAKSRGVSLTNRWSFFRALRELMPIAFGVR